MGQAQSANPRDIRYMQDSVADKIRNGKDLLDVFKELVDGTLEPSNMTPIEVVVIGGEYFAYDGNRRLLLFKVSKTIVDYSI